MATNDTKLSNIIGAPFTDYVLRQLANRASRNSTGTLVFGQRTDEEVLYLANKSAWVRLISSVDIILPPDDPNSNTTSINAFVNKLGIEGSGTFTSTAATDYTTSNSLAKNWILQAGTSLQNGNGINLRQGLGPNGSYGLGGTQELGYRPMPGLTSVTVETTGRLGSLRQATVNFKVWNMNQLNTIEALYFRLGYSMLLEWGHTQYYKNEDAKNVAVNGGVFTSKEIYGITDPFDANLWVEDIQRRIAIKREETSGNYDGMLGVVTNFTWSFNQQGGYDCVVRIVGLGSVMDSMRVNQVYKLPEGLLKQYKGAEAAFNSFLALQLALIKKDVDDLRKATAASGTGAATGGGKVTVPKTVAELLQAEKTYDNFALSTLTPTYGFDSITNYQSKTSRVDYAGIFQTPGPGSSVATFAIAQQDLTGLYISNPSSPSALTFISTKTGTEITLNIDLFNQFKDVAEGENYKKVDRNGKAPIELVSSFIDRNESGLTGLIVAQSQYAVSTITGGGVGGGGAAFSTKQVRLQDSLPTQTPTRGVAYVTSRYFETKTPVGSKTNVTGVRVNFTNPYSSNTDYEITRANLIDGVVDWSLNSKKATIQKFEYTKGTGVLSPGPALQGVTFEIEVQVLATQKAGVTDTYAGLIANGPNDPITGLRYIQDPNDATKPAFKVPLKIVVTTNNIGFIQSAVPPKSTSSTSGGGSTVSAGASAGTPAKVNTDQIDSSLGFASALHAMLTIVQVTSQEEAIKAKNPKDPYKNRIVVVSTRTATNTAEFYKDGIFKDVLGNKVTIDPQNPTFDLTAFAQKGFASELMADYKKFDIIPYVGETGGFQKITKSLVIKYDQNNLDGVTYYPSQFPVYISLGYLLAFMNNICLFYNSKTDPANQNQTGGNDNRPYVYIDFNPETNFCLTSPQQFSIDPLTCLVSAELDQPEYTTLFPKDLVPPSTTLWDPTGSNSVSSVLVSSGFGFKDDDKYRGKTMNIMLSTKYLLNTLRDFTTSNPDHAVNLQPFLERIMMDVNKCLGGMNLFRVAYRDDTNTIQIQDDQFVPSLAGEPTAVNRNVVIQNIKSNAIQSGQLPIFTTVLAGPNNTSVALPSLGIAREMQFKSVMSTKMASMIAISAQAYTGSINAKDHSELSYLNRNYRDRYKPFVKDQTNGTGGSNTNAVPATGTKTPGKTNNVSNDQQAAERFNEHVKTIYSSLKLVAEKIEPSKNYYIERISKTKSGDIVTSAAPFIPAELELTLDGISGIIMGNAFTIPKERLPLSLKNEIGPGTPDGFPKVGFIVSGLTHTIENNQWLTRIKGQMIKLREQSTLGITVAGLNPVQTGVAPLTAATSTTGGSTNSNRNDPNSPCYVPPFVLQAGRVDTLPARGKRRDGIIAWRNAFPGGQAKGLKAFLEAQTYFEGFYDAAGGAPASKSWRTNNPGNIGNTDDGNTNKLPSLTAGIERQIDYITEVINGANRNYPADPGLYEYISRYAPPCYRPDYKNNPSLYVKSTNDPIGYTNGLIAYLKGEYGINITGDTRLSEIISII